MKISIQIEVTSEEGRRLAAAILETFTSANFQPPHPARVDRHAGYDLLADLIQIWPAGYPKAASEDLLARLAELRPNVYAGWTPAQLTGVLKPLRIATAPIGKRIPGGVTDNRRGPRLADIRRVLSARQTGARP